MVLVDIMWFLISTQLILYSDFTFSLFLLNFYRIAIVQNIVGGVEITLTLVTVAIFEF